MSEPLHLPMKTLKFFSGGAFLRSESGSTFSVTGMEVPDCTRKDARDAIRAGASAAAAWSSRDPYNRGQVLYRVAEMLSARREEFVSLLVLSGVDASTAATDVNDAVAVWVHYAGWTDKVGQVLGTVNDVPSGMVSYTAPTSLGLVAAVCGATQGLSALARVAASALACGNAAVLVGSGAWCPSALVFAEVISTSDVPSGVLQLLSSNRPEVASTLAAASQVQGLDLSLVPDRADLAVAASETFTRVLRREPSDSLGRLRWQVERRTLWHPVDR